MARPRTFEEGRVVASAMDLFWQRGFGGTSLDALEQATGLNRSSLYNTFGGKPRLFCAVLDAYRDGPCQLMESPLRQKTGAAALLGYLDGLRAFVLAPGSERGCLMVNTALEADVDAATRERLGAHFTGLGEQLRRAFSHALQDGTINPRLDPDEGADWLLTFVRGVLSGAAAGVPSETLVRSLDAAIKQLELE